MQQAQGQYEFYFFLERSNNSILATNCASALFKSFAFALIFP